MSKWLSIALLVMAATEPAFGHDFDGPGGREGGGRHAHRVLKVFDANGRPVGPLVVVGSQAGVVLTVDGARTFAPIGRSLPDKYWHASRYGWFAGGPAYPTPDCSGPPVIANPPPVFRPSLIDREGASVTLLLATDAPTRAITVRSDSMGKSCRPLTDGHSGPPPYNAAVWSVQTTYQLSTIYPEPLTIHY